MLINVGDITEHGFSTSTLLKRYKTTHVCLNFRKFYQCFFFRGSSEALPLQYYLERIGKW